MFDIDREKFYLPENLVKSVSMVECNKLAEIYFAYFYFRIDAAPRHHKNIYKLFYVVCPEQQVVKYHLHFQLPPTEEKFE